MQAIIASNDPDERDYYGFVLRHAGFTVALRADLKGLAEQTFEKPLDLVVACAEDLDGLREDIKSLRAASEAPVIVLAQSTREEQVVSLLDAGADLVLPHPVGPRALREYCRSLLRRAGNIPAFSLPTLDLGEIALNPSTMTVQTAGMQPMRLTQLEFRLLYVLMTNRGQVIPSEVIVERVWGYSGTGSKDLVRGLVSRLRGKIEPSPNNPRLVHTVPGVGYMFQIDGQ